MVRDQSWQNPSRGGLAWCVLRETYIPVELIPKQLYLLTCVRVRTYLPTYLVK